MMNRFWCALIVTPRRSSMCPSSAPRGSAVGNRHKRQHRHSRWHTKPNRKNARSHPRCDEHVPAAFFDVTGSEALAETGRHDWPAEERQPHLSSVRVPRERERHPRRHVWKDIRIVTEENDWESIVWNGGQRGGDVVAAGP